MSAAATNNAEFQFAPGETNVMGETFSPSIILFWLKTHIAASSTRVMYKAPNTILGIIPLGAQTRTLPIKNIASVETNVKFNLGSLIMGIIFTVVALNIFSSQVLLGFIILLFGLSMLSNIMTAQLTFVNPGGGRTNIVVSIFEKAKLATVASEINQRIFADNDQIRHQEAQDMRQNQYMAQTNQMMLQQQMLQTMQQNQQMQQMQQPMSQPMSQPMMQTQGQMPTQAQMGQPMGQAMGQQAQMPQQAAPTQTMPTQTMSTMPMQQMPSQQYQQPTPMMPTQQPQAMPTQTMPMQAAPQQTMPTMPLQQFGQSVPQQTQPTQPMPTMPMPQNPQEQPTALQMPQDPQALQNPQNQQN